MPVKIGTMTTPTSPFEFIHESGNRVQEKDTSFAEEFFKQQSEGVSHEEMEAMLKKIDEQAGWNRMGRQRVYTTVRKIAENCAAVLLCENSNVEACGVCLTQ